MHIIKLHRGEKIQLRNFLTMPSHMCIPTINLHNIFIFPQLIKSGVFRSLSFMANLIGKLAKFGIYQSVSKSL